MECDYADHLDLDWNYLMDERLKEFSCQNGSKQYSYDEVLEKVFSSGKIYFVSNETVLKF